MGDLNPGMHNIPWGLEITGLGMGTVFLMLAVLWFFLWALTALFPPKKEEAEAVEAAPAAPAVAAAAAVPAVTDGDLTEAEMAAIAVAIHTATGQSGVPSLVANQSGTGLSDSRWVNVGRSIYNQTWQRS